MKSQRKNNIIIAGVPRAGKKFKGDRKYYVCDCASAERFIEIAEHDYQEAAIRANTVILR